VLELVKISDIRIDGSEHLVCKSLFDLEDTGNVVLCMEVAEHIEQELEDQVVAKVVSTVGKTLIWTKP
jgi:2-polyprenyl-3-methyl-5-hydroxy-6-metoxy-1,4-benzoquinol methylase